MWTSKLFWKLFFVYTGLSLTLAGGFLWLVSGLFESYAVQQAAAGLEKVGQMIAAQHSSGTTQQWRDQLVERTKVIPLLREQRLLLLDEHGKAFYGFSVPGSDYSSLPEVEAALQGRTTHSDRRLQEGEILVRAARPVLFEGKVQAVILLTHSLADLDARFATVSRDLWFFAVMTGCCSVILTYLVISGIVRPLAQLSEGALAIAADDQQMLASFESYDELGVLGAAFNQMQSKLAGRVKQLKENTERLETVLGSMAEGVIAVDAEEAVLLANEASRQLLDIGMVYPLGRSLLDVTRSLPLQTAVSQALRTGQVIRNEFEVHGPHRRVLAIRATCLPGEPCPGVMVVLHDISEIRRLENLRREFAANVSHELKTPLAAIKAYAETLKLGALNDPENSMAFVMRIEEQSERLYELILDLLQLARVESDQEAFEIVDLELSEAVLDCVDQYTDLAASKNIKLSASGPNESVVVQGDEEGVRTIISNLINNAIKYTPEGGSVFVRWSEEQAMALIEVEDTGIGIALKDQSRVFERFYRVDKARSREMGGTGLGLSIVKHLVQAFGGSVGLESQPKKGSVFQVRLPCSRQQNIPPTIAVSS